MKAITLARTALVVSLFSIPAMAAPAAQPPMNDFRQAFYNCDNGAAFLMAYDGARPRSATMTTSNNNKEYPLKREQTSSGVEFASGPVKFWTDGQEVRVEGTELTLQNCKLKS
jgi:membrane-bound inhibitor of C-type lysozyme